MKLGKILEKIFVGETNNTFLQFFRYLFVGGGAFAVDYGLFLFFTYFLHLYYLLSATLSFIAGLLVNYFLSTSWVFNKRTVKNKYDEFLFFCDIGVIGLGFNVLFLWIFTGCLGIYPWLSKIITTAIVYFWNFFARKYILFNR